MPESSQIDNRVLERGEWCPFVDKFAAQVLADFPMPAPNGIQIKNVRGGVYRSRTHMITLPASIFKEGLVFVKSFIIHELIHSIIKGHGPRFKRLERLILKKYGIEPVYSKAYAMMLLVDGYVAWRRNGCGW